ncbi:MAG: hypothetical protein U0992_12780 [Planctomycetaceae bacterium]
MSKRIAAVFLLTFLASASTSQAGFVSVAIDSLVNTDVRTAINGNNLPMR